MLTPDTHQALARELHQAEKSRTQVEHFSKRYPAMEMADSYAIQRAWVQIKRDEGRKILGHKIGLTSRAMQISSQITEPDYGAMTDDMLFPEGADQKRARAVCMGCSVRSQCLAEALDNRIEWGVWGGMTERERRELLRQRTDISSWQSVLCGKTKDD